MTPQRILGAFIRLLLIGNDQVVAAHLRRLTQDQCYFEPWHYVPILSCKPGVLRNGAPFKDWDLLQGMQHIRVRCLKRPGGDREFIELLLMAQRHGVDTVNTACELALTQGTGHLFTIVNILHRLTEEQRPAAFDIVNYPQINAMPVASCQRHNGLMTEVARAESC